MKKALIYIVSFAVALVLSFIVVALLFALVLGFLSFVAWSLPVVSPFNWPVFRIIFAIAFTTSVFWLFSKENKQWVEGVLKDLEGKK